MTTARQHIIESLRDGPMRRNDIIVTSPRSRTQTDRTLQRLAAKRVIARTRMGVYRLRVSADLYRNWYLSGPMSGLPELNFPMFNGEAERLRAAGYRVVNPAEINPDPCATWESYMRADIKALMDCDGLLLLPGWQASRGVKVERGLAETLGFQIMEVGEFWARHYKQVQAAA